MVFELWGDKTLTLKKEWFTSHTKISNLTMVYLGDDCMQDLVSKW